MSETVACQGHITASASNAPSDRGPPPAGGVHGFKVTYDGGRRYRSVRRAGGDGTAKITGDRSVLGKLAATLVILRIDSKDPRQAALRVASALRRRASGRLTDAPHRPRRPSCPAKSGHDLHGSLSPSLVITFEIGFEILPGTLNPAPPVAAMKGPFEQDLRRISE